MTSGPATRWHRDSCSPSAYPWALNDPPASMFAANYRFRPEAIMPNPASNAGGPSAPRTRSTGRRHQPHWDRDKQSWSPACGMFQTTFSRCSGRRVATIRYCAHVDTTTQDSSMTRGRRKRCGASRRNDLPVDRVTAAAFGPYFYHWRNASFSNVTCNNAWGE
jgi:hypothetical protein